jgi:sodium/potassium/calcium exchanger 6
MINLIDKNQKVFNLFIKVALHKLFGVLPIYAIALIIGFTGALFIAKFTSLNQKPKFHWILSYLGFVVSVVWIYTIANEIVNLLTVKSFFLN